MGVYQDILLWLSTFLHQRMVCFKQQIKLLQAQINKEKRKIAPFMIICQAFCLIKTTAAHNFPHVCYVIDRPSVAGAVLQSPPSFVKSVCHCTLWK